ncbi:MAG: winged helix-turn-helix domain-containing protein, partial [Chloroflexi bacterium]|nr:winged helix-turn-helix domain-containing protein [Chloroflexota bacterium]
VWGADYVDSTDYLKVYIQRLRVKLRDDPHNAKLIVSERGVGYKLTK